MSAQLPPEPQLPTTDEFLALLRSAVTGLLTEQHGFTPVLAMAIVEAGTATVTDLVRAGLRNGGGR
jgi:hypothetical protein